MNKVLKAILASSLVLCATPALAQEGHRDRDRDRGGGYERDHDRRGDYDRAPRRGEYERHRGGYDRRHDRLDNRRYNRRWDRQWDRRWRDRGNACGLMGYSRGCRSYSSDGAYIIFRLFEDLYCYRRAPYGVYQVICPNNWWDY